ncbi:methyltransferase, FxLD system [Amycolatopsis nalaikhensis]|uniref:Protein-L-isoaspartate O-methyltransferase n=1 Tax=Amycolatopsis nalaikhensis TaxID=715472 RepID=A0ABY8XQI5_9PSEU|nr:methyltransferase, FxLD system [Amycolatopsis sp. 2-2]WIV57856.1 methyltransferase, FxLD system [Amycolatopsis sp. 2-2]
MTTARDVNADETTQADGLRAAMVTELRELGVIRSDRVATAVGTVPRHLFAPGEPLERAYAAKTILQTKRDERGVAISMISAADIQAMMLEQAQLEPGMRVLEIGSGGYNAALIAELVGETGQVTTVDIDPEVIDRTRRCLAAAGYDRVKAVVADADGGVPDHAPYDCVIATTSAWDIPPAWTDQLAEGGRIVVPLRMRGLTRSVVFERDGDRLVSRGYELCSFVPMQGVNAPAERVIPLAGDEVSLRIDGDQPADADRLREALSQPRVEAWSGVTVSGVGRSDGLHLWLALNLPKFGVLTAQKQAAARGLVAHAWALGMPTAVGEDSFAYLGLRGVTPDRSTCEFGAYGHGPDAKDLADQLLQHIQSWDGSNLDATIEVYPADTPDGQLPEEAFVLNKKHTRVVISWPHRRAS